MADITSYFAAIRFCFSMILDIIFVFLQATGRTPGWCSVEAWLKTTELHCR